MEESRRQNAKDGLGCLDISRQKNTPDGAECRQEVISITELLADEERAAKENPVVGWYSLPPAFRACAAQSRNAVLLETAKPEGRTNRSLLFLDPYDELIAWTANDLDKLLREADRHLSAGAFVAGFFCYECGNHFVGVAEKPFEPSSEKKPIAWLGVFRNPIEFDHSTGQVRGTLPPSQAESSPPELQPLIKAAGIEIHLNDYLNCIQRIQEYLHAGDTYQVNFTDRIRGTSDSTPLAIYEHLLKQQPVPFAALIHQPWGTLISFSPELFFRVSAGQITVRPMKGTWARGRNSMEDHEAAYQLVHDEKNRSEHVMIVDLLRNDLGRICEYGSVKVENLFQAERYKTLFQMTSTISGRLRAGLTASTVFKALFPSGSVTGAPKRRTMEIIREIEDHPRGVYTGAIGYFSPDGNSCFNVAIRTMEFSGNTFHFGVGGGITAGSDAHAEYDECRLKAAFLTRKVEPFSLIETMRASSGIPLLDLHMKRLAESAEYFDIRYDAQRLHYELENAARECGSIESCVRVELDESGLWKISTSRLDPAPWNGRLLLAEAHICSRDVFRQHKTTNRQILNQQLAQAQATGFDEVMFLNEHAVITECAISNIFFHIEGKWLTPALTCGVLPGVFRSTLLNSLGSVMECELRLEDIKMADRVHVCNAVRGVRSVKQIKNAAGVVIWTSKED